MSDSSKWESNFDPQNEKLEEDSAFVHAVIEGLADLEEGRELSLADAKGRLGLS